jgi:hypothetical protein
MVHHEREKKDTQEQNQEQGDPSQSLIAGELGMRRFKFAAALILIMVIVGHGRPTNSLELN